MPRKRRGSTMLSANREIEMVEVFEATTLLVSTTAFSLWNKFFLSLLLLSDGLDYEFDVSEHAQIGGRCDA